jgi:hypothetical protein
VQTWRFLPSATWCSTFDQNRTLEEEGASKAMLRMGTGPIVAAEGSAAQPFVACVLRGSNQPPLVFQGDITPEHAATSRFWLASAESTLSPTPAVGSFPFKLETRAELAYNHVIFDGTHFDERDPVTASMGLCDGACDGDEIPLIFDACAFPEASVSTHDVTFEGGSLQMVLEIGWALIVTQPGRLASISVTLDGTASLQDDFWKLWYRPAHHHTVRNAIAWLDAPIGEVAAVQVDGLTSSPADDLVVISLLNADGEVIETREVLDVAFRLDNPEGGNAP